MRPDIMLIGHVSKDIMIDHLGEETRLTGGAVVQSSFAALRSGSEVMAVTKVSSEDASLLDALQSPGLEWVTSPSKATTSIRNRYYTEDKERRDVELLSQADPFTLDDIPKTVPRVFHLAGLFAGEIPDDLIEPLSSRAAVALDAQGVLRTMDAKGDLLFRDWVRKKELLKFVRFFKVDAAEAEILTGCTDREEAARMLFSWGAGEVMLTHHTEVLLYSKEGVCRAPYTNSSSVGRTGRGDTTFAAYLAWRREHSISESVRFAAALCSLKMESPGPFSGTVKMVLDRMGRR
jgi:sugar/nucleoside kinase (ribokinase family)